MPKFVFKHKKTVEQLYSPKEELAMDAIKTLRNSGDPSVIPYLVDLYVSTDKPKIESALGNFLRDIKDQSAVKALMDAIANPRFDKKLTQLVSFCWQTPLNFSSYLDVFVDITIEKDYQTSIEAFTVVEEALPYTSPSKISNEIQKLKEKITSVPEEKQLLLKELIATMQTYL